MRENTVKSIWAKGGVVVNGWLAIPSSFSAEVMAHQGFDSLVVDMQHGVVDYQTAVTMLQAISTTGVIPFARVPWNDPAYIMKILDAGAYGIICPMINSRKEAEQLVRTCKYAPKGYRSFGPVRASIYAGADYAQHANDTIVVMPMIETKEAVQNIDEILSTPGIDAIYVGPADLSLTLGCTPKLDQTEAPVVEALGKILDAGAYGIICPMINSRKEAEQLVRTCKYAPKGYRSFGPVRASIYGGSDYAQHANDTIVVMPMIETKEAVQNIDEILTTPGVDAIYVGPADLSLTLGCTPKLDQTEPPVVEALGKILAACKRHKVIAGLHNATSGYALKMASQGWQFVTLASDTRFLAARAAEEAAAVKQTVASGKLPAY
ncbi:MAG TPA: aldolase/citrate lyase family protein [Methylomirabilota bacterium]|nr:aldolase/citrate lyase family protein [Methylomirabilota bacterium]